MWTHAHSRIPYAAHLSQVNVEPLGARLLARYLQCHAVPDATGWSAAPPAAVLHSTPPPIHPPVPTQPEPYAPPARSVATTQMTQSFTRKPREPIQLEQTGESGWYHCPFGLHLMPMCVRAGVLNLRCRGNVRRRG
jgi:hypothetical protein